MSNITLLPIYRLAAGVQPDEDWTLVLAFFLSDGLTPIDLTGITFTAYVGDFAPVTGEMSGMANNVMTFSVLEADKVDWAEGVNPLEINATDGTTHQDLLGFSTLTVGMPQIVDACPILPIGVTLTNILSYVPPGLLTAITLANASAIATAVGNLPPNQRLALVQALLASLPNLENTGTLPPTGEPYIGSDGFIAISQ